MTIFRYILDIIIPTVTAYLANGNAIYQFLKDANILADEVNVAAVKEFFMIVNIIFTVVVLPLQIICAERKKRKAEQKIDGLNAMLKQFIQNNLVHITKNENFSFDMRIFVPERNVFQYLKGILGKGETWFTIRNISPFANKDITEHLCFRVAPNPQGLVGAAYAENLLFMTTIYRRQIALTIPWINCR